MSGLRDFIESKCKKKKFLRLSLWFSTFILALIHPFAAGIWLIIESLGSIWKYDKQSLEEHIDRIGRAIIVLRFLILASSVSLLSLL